MESIMTKFSARDRSQIERVLRKYGPGLTKTLGDWLQKWVNVVSDIEKGYLNLYIEDYENDLSVRDILQEIIESLSFDGQELLMQLIRPIDERFLRSTRELKRPLKKDAPQHYFWWYRAPKIVDRDILDYLRGEKLI